MSELITLDNPERAKILEELRLPPGQGRTMGVDPPTAPPTKQNRYHNVAQPIVIDSHRFPSRKEGQRYTELKQAELAGQIDYLQIQVLFPLVVNGVKIFPRGYVADMTYIEKQRDGSAKLIVEDCKGVRTDIYIIKRQLMLAVWGIAIRET